MSALNVVIHGKFVIKLKQSDVILLTELPSTILKSPSEIMYVFLRWFLIRWVLRFLL